MARKESYPTYTIYTWKSGEQTAMTAVYAYPSEQAASEKMSNGAKLLGLNYQKLDNLGDEASFYKSNQAGSTIIRFRKSKFFVQVNGSSFEIAERFAKQIAELIK